MGGVGEGSGYPLQPIKIREIPINKNNKSKSLFFNNINLYIIDSLLFDKKYFILYTILRHFFKKSFFFKYFFVFILI